MGTATLPNGPVLTELVTDAGPVEALEISVGNPHAVIETEDPAAHVRDLGPAVEMHPHFPTAPTWNSCA